MAVPGAHWRDSARSARFFFVDALAALPLVLFFVHIRLWTLGLAIAAVLFFAVLERFKFTVPVFKRWIRSTLAGPQRISHPWWRE